jgi:hypothetical protein
MVPPFGVPPEGWQLDPDNRASASLHLDTVEYGVDDILVGRVILEANWTLSGAAMPDPSKSATPVDRPSR